MPTRSLASVIPPADDDTGADNAPQDGPTAAPAAKPDTPPTTNQDAATPTGIAARKVPTRPSSSTATPRNNRRSVGTPTPATTPTKPTAAPDKATPETAPAAERTGRPRIPKTGPITRVTVDLAVTEQTQLDKLTGQIGREIGRGHGKNKIYPQHLMRVAIRRLLTDDAFRREVTADLAENRDELKRPQR